MRIQDRSAAARPETSVDPLIGTWINRRMRLIVLVSLLLAVGCATRGGVDGNPVSEDQRITAEVLRILEEDDDMVSADLRVETRDGVVVLSGVQSSLEQVREMLKKVSRVRGVREVVNRVRIVRGRPLKTVGHQPSRSLAA